MSYENVLRDKLKLKGKALDVQSTGVKKKKKKDRSFSKHFPTEENISATNVCLNSSLASSSAGNNHELSIKNLPNADSGNPENTQVSLLEEDYLTPAERKFHERRLKLEKERLAKLASKSHRDRIMEFNQYLANLSEHYDIPKVGPG